VDFDLIEHWLERRGVLLDAATALLQHAAWEGREFTSGERDAFDYAAGKTDELGSQAGALMADLTRRGYRFPRPVH
jgi:hypothetical protein